MLCPLSYEGAPSNLCRVGLGRTVRNYDRDARVEAINLTDKQNPASPRGAAGRIAPSIRWTTPGFNHMVGTASLAAA